MTVTPAIPTDSRPVGALAVPETAGGLLTRIAETEADWDDLDDLDMVPAGEGAGVPFIRTDGNIGGGLYLDEVKVDEVRCVIAARSISRSKFEKPWEEDKNARPICYSSDGLVPDDNVPEPQAAKCVTCPFSFEKLGNTKATCRKNLELLAYLPKVDELDIMRLRVGGISVRAAMAYWNGFRTRIPKKHPIGFVTTVTMRQVDTANGPKLAMHFERGEELHRDAVEALVADARRRKAMWQQMIAEDVTSATAQSTDEGPGPFDDPEPGEPEPAVEKAETAVNSVGIRYDPETSEVIPQPVAAGSALGRPGDDLPF